MRLLALQLADYDDPAMLIGSGFDAETQALLMRESGLLSDRATSFLDDFTDPGPDDAEGAGLPNPADRPQLSSADPSETQYVQVHWLVTS